MSKETKLMAECLEEAYQLLRASLQTHTKVKVRGLGPDATSVVTVAVALYQERCRQAGVVGGNTELRFSPWPTHPGSSGVQTAKPMVCPDCALPWEPDHVCTAAGRRGTARWPAP